MDILVTGSSGMLGKHLQDVVSVSKTDDNWIFTSSKDANLFNIDECDGLLEKYSPDFVVNLAAKCGGIKDNAEKKYDYMVSNVLINTNIVESCRRANIKKMISISSNCAFPSSVQKYPMTFDDLHTDAPEYTNIGYGYSKRLMQIQIDLCNEQYNTDYSYIVVSNMFSEYDKFSESAHFISRFIRKIWETKKNNEKTITLFGDGSQLRQFLYAEDFARFIYDRATNNISESVIFVPPWNYSVEEMARMTMDVAEVDVDIQYTGQLGGQHRKDFVGYKDFQFTELKDAIAKVYHIMNKKWEKE